MGGREGLEVARLWRKNWERERERDIGLRGDNKRKMFYQNFKCKHFTQICPSWFSWLKIFNCKTNTVKCENIFLQIFYIKTNEL